MDAFWSVWSLDLLLDAFSIKTDMRTQAQVRTQAYAHTHTHTHTHTHPRTRDREGQGGSGRGKEEGRKLVFNAQSAMTVVSARREGECVSFYY